jgi:hypothetical protein
MAIDILANGDSMGSQRTKINTHLQDMSLHTFLATATRSGTVVAIVAEAGAKKIRFVAPTNFSDGDTYTLNGSVITIKDLNGEDIKEAWSQGSPVEILIEGGNGFFKGSPTGGYLRGDNAIISYTGTMDDYDVTLSGKSYRILTFTTTGNMSISPLQADKLIKADICVIGAGANGISGANSSYDWSGGYMIHAYGITLRDAVITIGAHGVNYYNNAAGGATTLQFTDWQLPLVAGGGSAGGINSSGGAGGIGGNGGGGGARNGNARPGGAGDGLYKTPFGDTTNFQRCCGGGSGGSWISTGSVYIEGGQGGSNGSGGANAQVVGSSPSATPGVDGGGDGNGGNATRFGAGGGGGGYNQGTGSSGGNGYNGAVIIRLWN